ncbi:MAG: DUF2306 domain-containing protein [Kordiimonadaceae bacterium]|nr:DUF2306 domain-containing protein [Kordiimonadaceae bacterium]
MKNKFLTISLTVLAVAIAGYALAMVFAVDLSNNIAVGNHFHDRPIALYAHLFFGALALLIGPFQFSEKLRNSRKTLHRWMGRSYVVFCLSSGVAGFFMALSSTTIDARTGFAVLAVAWIYTTVQAYRKARARDFAAHKNWMIRSFALTCAAITLRILLPVQLIGGVPFETAYIIISWACWVPNLMLAEWLVRRKPAISAASA